VDPAALKRTVNARIDAAEQKGATWKLTRGGESLPFTEIYQRLRNLITACRCRLSKLAPGLFEHEELVTLGLSQQAELKNKKSLGATLNPNQRQTGGEPQIGKHCRRQHRKEPCGSFAPIAHGRGASV